MIPQMEISMQKFKDGQRGHSRASSGWVSGLVGVLIFSGSLPATRIAVQGLDPIFLTVARATIAGTLGLILLLVFRETRPARRDLLPLVVVALGVVVGGRTRMGHRRCAALPSRPMAPIPSSTNADGSGTRASGVSRNACVCPSGAVP